MILLGFDLGSVVCGWAVLRGPTLARAELDAVGIWKLSRPRDAHRGERYARLRQRLLAIGSVSGIRPDVVAYERVEAHTSSRYVCAKCGTVKQPAVKGRKRLCPACGGVARRKTSMNVAAAHAYGATEAYLLEWCTGIGITPIPVPVAAVKRAGTGKGGGAGTAKADMLAAARARYPGHTFRTDDAAEALFVAEAAKGLAR